MFADLGLRNPEEYAAKAALVAQIAAAIAARSLTQIKAAAVLGTSPPKVSELLSGQLEGFSKERLIRYLNALDRDVQIVVSPKLGDRKHASPRLRAHASGPPGEGHPGGSASYRSSPAVLDAPSLTS